jgi:hypothetical protein
LPGIANQVEIKKDKDILKAKCEGFSKPLTRASKPLTITLIVLDTSTTIFKLEINSICSNRSKYARCGGGLIFLSALECMQNIGTAQAFDIACDMQTNFQAFDIACDMLTNRQQVKFVRCRTKKPKKEMTAAISGNADGFMASEGFAHDGDGWAVSREEPVESEGEGRLRFNRLLPPPSPCPPPVPVIFD